VRRQHYGSPETEQETPNPPQIIYKILCTHTSQAELPTMHKKAIKTLQMSPLSFTQNCRCQIKTGLTSRTNKRLLIQTQQRVHHLLLYLKPALTDRSLRTMQDCKAPTINTGHQMRQECASLTWFARKFYISDTCPCQAQPYWQRTPTKELPNNGERISLKPDLEEDISSAKTSFRERPRTAGARGPW
jgi:hypothetical protein